LGEYKMGACEIRPLLAEEGRIVDRAIMPFSET
jgi:hypothetical protein